MAKFEPFRVTTQRSSQAVFVCIEAPCTMNHFSDAGTVPRAVGIHCDTQAKFNDDNNESDERRTDIIKIF